MSYRVFRRAWWRDQANTVPVEHLSRGTTIKIVKTESEARYICRHYNMGDDGERIARAFGVAYEFEKI